jgi:DNA-binding transcriptional LysR family regulator
MVEIQTGLSLDRLRTFCLVVKAGSIAAATADPNRQSLFSRQIKELEEALGKKLVQRQGKQLKPTAEGLELAALAGGFFTGLDELGSDLKKPILLAGGESIIRWIVLPALSRLSNPTFQWSLRSMRTMQVMEALRSGAVDLGVVRDDALTDEFISKPAGEIDYRWVFPRKLLPGRTAAGIYDAPRLPFALLSGDGKLAKQVMEVATRHQLRLDVRMELESFSLLLEAVKTRSVGALIPSKAAVELPKDEFAVANDEALAVPPRLLALAAYAKTYNFRPRLRRAFEECNRALR